MLIFKIDEVLRLRVVSGQLHVIEQLLVRLRIGRTSPQRKCSERAEDGGPFDCSFDSHAASPGFFMLLILSTNVSGYWLLSKIAFSRMQWPPRTPFGGSSTNFW